MESKEQKTTLAVATVTAFMAPFMISSTNVALPAIGKEFHVNAVLLGWVATSYLLATAVFLLPAGKYADLHGRRKMFMVGVALFTLGALGGAAANGIAFFLATRVLQGIGAAMFLTTGMAIITVAYPPQRRGWAIGILVTAVYVGLASGPFIGGLLTSFWGWRSMFVVIFVLGLCSLGVTLRFLPGKWRSTDEPFDSVGSLVYGLSILLWVYGGTRVPSITGWWLFGLGCGGLVLFYYLQRHQEKPVFDVTLFETNRVFLFSSLAALIHYAATFAITFQLSLYLQYVKGLSPKAAGTVLMVQPIIMALFAAKAGSLSDRLEVRLLASLGMGITVCCLVIFVFLGKGTPIWFVTGILAMLGFGFALFSSPNMSAIMGAVEPHQYGLASGCVATMRLLGQVGSMTIATTFLAFFVGSEQMSSLNNEQFLLSMQNCFGFFAVLCLIGLAFSLMRNKREEREEEKL